MKKLFEEAIKITVDLSKQTELLKSRGCVGELIFIDNIRQDRDKNLLIFDLYAERMETDEEEEERETKESEWKQLEWDVLERAERISGKKINKGDKPSKQLKLEV